MTCFHFIESPLQAENAWRHVGLRLHSADHALHNARLGHPRAQPFDVSQRRVIVKGKFCLPPSSLDRRTCILLRHHSLIGAASCLQGTDLEAVGQREPSRTDKKQRFPIAAIG
ncbi:hypothetical protein [Stappia sp. TSB10GB4]|uniref:hypothetical protein n=1 Tax=Stappia sp. TSB10GB4 TaxID=2003584 RepID=UPI001648806F|nr:hypothetical protein [Stappia sp. TSB10GB4]